MFAHFTRVFSDTTPGLRPKVIGIYSLLIAVNVALWVLTLLSAISYPSLLPIALLAYSFGLRHAFDADHIAAIDNVTRKLMQEKKKPVGVGFFFSLGHSTVVLVMAMLVAAGSAAIASNLAGDNSGLRFWGSVICSSFSGLFLFGIAIMNIIILVQIVKTFRRVTQGNAYDEQEVEEYLNNRGFFTRLFRRLFKTVDKSWKMYPVGFLFGLGFDTATEVGLLVISGTLATRHIPFFVVLLFPLLFTAGMSLCDTTDGVMMLGAYGWAFVKPIRKLFYNVTITTVSVLVALGMGTIEVLSLLSGEFNLSGGIWDVLNNLQSGSNFGILGISIVGMFILSWMVSTVIYKVKKYDDLEALPVNSAVDSDLIKRQSALR